MLNSKSKEKLLIAIFGGQILLILIAFLILPIYYYSTKQSSPTIPQSLIVKNLADWLERYSSEEDDYSKGTLASEIGSAYYSLQQYPWAFLFFLRAHSYQPRSYAIKEQLYSTADALGITIFPGSLKKQLLLRPFLSKNERVYSFAGLTLFAIGLFVLSWSLQKKRQQLQVMAIASAVMALCIASIVLIDRFFVPEEAVVVAPTLLLLQPQEKALSSGKILAPGDVTVVLEILDQGKWLKIKTDDGNIGYVFYPSIRII
jgi:hypothetical protein